MSEEQLTSNKKFNWDHLSIISVDWSAHNLAASNLSALTAPESKSSNFAPKIPTF
jgi:hypothetical protein